MTTPARMPVSLMIMLCLLGLGIVSNVVAGAIVSAAIGAALLAGLVVGNDGVRKFMIFLAAIQLVWNAILIAMSVGAGAATYLIALWVGIGIILPVLLIWTLTRPDVREWMFRKSFKLDGIDSV